jgi:hypothetical protein
MKPHIKLDITVGCMREMTAEQFEALKRYILADGQWETQTEPLHISGSDYLGVQLEGIFIVIEKDGYAHS